MRDWYDVVECLISRGLWFQLVILDTHTRSVEEAARSLGVEPGKVVKTLIVVAGSRPVAVVIPGDKRLDPPALASCLGARGARMAGKREAEGASGFPVGGIPPLCHGLPLVVDEEVAESGVVYGGGGRSGVMVALRGRDIASAAWRICRASAPRNT